MPDVHTLGRRLGYLAPSGAGFATVSYRGVAAAHFARIHHLAGVNFFVIVDMVVIAHFLALP